MPAFTPPKIETPRLVLTWPTAEQIDGYYASIVGTNIFDTIFWDGPSDPQDLHDWWAENQSRDPSNHSLELNFAIIERDSNRCIGGTGLRPIAREPRVIDLGYALATDSHGKGYATEAVGALVNEAFAHRGAERIFGNAFVGNQASRRVMEKLGFIYEGTQHRTVCKNGTWIDQWMLAITRPDWQRREKPTSQSHPHE